MNVSNRRSPLAAIPSLSALGLIAATLPAAGLDRDVSVGSAGELYMVREGVYGELFPGEGLAEPENAVLAVDVLRPDQSSERLMVPGTESADAEDSASILFEDQSGTLFVLWHARVNSIHKRLSLIGLRDGAWTEAVEISGNPFSWKSSPHLAVTRDTFRTELGDGDLRTWTRTIVHLLWWEVSATGEPAAHYTPVTFLDGVYTGWNPVYLLSELDLDAAEVPLAATPSLARAPRIEPGGNGQNVVIAFVAEGSDRLITLAVEILPGEFSFLAERVRHQIIDVGRELLPGKPAVLADKVRHQIIDVGARLRLHPSVSAYAAQQAEAEILAAGPGTGASALAERVRHQIIDVGARMTDRGLVRLRAAQRLEVLETSNGSVAGAPANYLRVVEASNRPTPETGQNENALFLSRNGGEVLASWLEDGAVYYRESRGQEWSDVRSLRLGGELDLARAREILDRRADERSDN
jgi:hypothetical protein